MNTEQLLRDTLQREADRTEHDPTPVDQVAWRAATIQRAKRTRIAATTLVAAAAVTALALIAPAMLTPDSEPDPLKDDRTLAVEDADTVGDMTDAGAWVPAPERSLYDVSSTTLTHGARSVSIDVDYVDLQRTSGEQPNLWIVMRTNEGTRRYVSLDVWRRDWSGRARMFDGTYQDFRCAVRHSIDYDVNVMTVSFPRRCVSDPNWVTFRIGVYVEGLDTQFADDALLDRPMTDHDEIFVQSGRVHREAAN